MPGFFQDLRFALRMLWKYPAFTVIATLTLGLGIGTNTVIFSVVNAVVVRPLPYPQPEQLVRLYTAFPTMKFDKFWISPPEYWDLVHQAKSYSSIGAWGTGGAPIGGGERPERVPAAYTTASFLPTIGVQPALGRFFLPEEDPPNPGGSDHDQPNQPIVVVISHSLWQRTFGGDKNILGRTITVDAFPVKVVGVMPAGFNFPDEAEVWVPSGENPANPHRGNHRLSLVARLKPGVTIEQARAELKVLMAGWREQYKGHHPLAEPNHPMRMFPLKGEVVGALRWALLLLQGAVAFVLLIACANVSNLLLARAEARSREVAIRTALGAGRGRLARQFLTESALLGLLGGALGLLLAFWGLDLAVALLPEGAPRAGEIKMDGAVLAFGLASAVVTSFLFGLAPILHARIANLHGALKEGQRATGGVLRQRFRRLLVVTEVALAVVLVIGCGLMVRSFLRLQRVELGYRADHLLTFQIELPQRNYPDNTQAIEFLNTLQERLRGSPGVEGASLATGLPPARPVNANDIFFVGKAQPRPGDPEWNVDFWQTVGDDYFQTMGIRLLEGRLFDSRDVAEAPSVALVNHAFARRFYPGESPIGKQVHATGGPNGPSETIVGIVADVKQQGVEAPTGTEIYFPMRQSTHMGFAPRIPSLLVRTHGDPRNLAGAVRATVAGLDPQLAVARLRTMDQLMYEAVARPRFLTVLLAAFALLALVLAAVGIYGVMSYSVERRTHEIGIRMALGAQAANVRGLVLRQGLLLTLVGVALGLGAAFAVNSALSRVLSGLLFDVKAVDPSTFTIVPMVVVAVAGLACWLPALRATRIDPMIALRNE